MTKQIALAETADEVKEIIVGLSKYNYDMSDIIWVPVEIEADIMLRELKINPLAVSDILSVEDRKNIFIDAVYWSNNWLNNCRMEDINIGWSTAFSLKDLFKDNIYHYFDYIFYLVSIIESIVSRHPRVLFIVSTSKSSTVQGVSHNKEYLLQNIVKLAAKRNNIEIQEIDQNIDLCSPNKVTLSEFRRKIKTRIFKTCINKLGSSDKESIKLTGSVKNKLNGKKILILGAGHSEPFWRLEPLCKTLEDETDCELIPLYYSKDPYYKNNRGISLSYKRKQLRTLDEFLQLQQKIAVILKKSSILKGLIYRGYNVSDLLNKKLKWILEQYLPEYWLDRKILSKITLEHDFDLLIGAASSSSETSFFAALNVFNENNIPTLLIPHGVQFCQYPESDSIRDNFNFISPVYYSHYAVVSEYTRTRLLESGIGENKVGCTGSLEPLRSKNINGFGKALTRLSLEISSSKKTIIYFLGRATREFHMNYVNITFDEARKSISDVINIANVLDLQLIIKPHPAFRKAKQWIKSWGLEGNYKIVLDQVTSSALLSIADLVIASKSSIAIEALDYNPPIVIFEHDHRELHYFDDLASPFEKPKHNYMRPFIRATGYEELLTVCDGLLLKTDEVNSYREDEKTVVPWIHNNRDNQQVVRMVEYIGEIFDEC
jgi:hypothetical protein